MKYFLKYILHYIMGFFAIIYPYKVNELVYHFYSLLYSSWILHFISGADSTVYI